MTSTSQKSVDLGRRASTLVELMALRAEHQPTEAAYTFLEDGETESGLLTYQELEVRARAIAVRLRELGAEGQRALLLYPAGLEFVAAFMGCLLAGVTAVPAYPPRANKHLHRLLAVVEDAQATVVMTTQALLPRLERAADSLGAVRRLHWLTTDDVQQGLATAWRAPRVSPETLAFLQYTSGSTGSPKGVMVSHGNLLHNLEMLRQGFGHGPDTRLVSWLPLFHDMGLIAVMLEALYLGRPCVMMPPVAFLQSPVNWLKALSRYRGTCSGGPNFAFDLCVDKIGPEQREGLDLSSWQLAFNGAEPVRVETLERFAAAFAPHGFRREAFYPCYGMAESTVMISGGLIDAPPVIQTISGDALDRHLVREVAPEAPDARRVLGCGRAWMDERVLIVDPETLRECPSGRVGEIWVSSPSVAQGYWNRPEATQSTFKARVEDTGEGPFLRTGDLGYRVGEELFVTGRLKDVIIIRGRNHYPQDIEQTVEESHSALRRNSGAAFSVEVGGEERLVIVQEVERVARKADMTEVVDAIRAAVVEQHDLQPHSVVLIRPASISKTSSGKIQRRGTRAAFLEGSLEVVAQWREGEAVERAPARPQGPSQPEPSAVRQWLVDWLAARLKVTPASVDVRVPFSRLGLDSATAVGLSGELQTWLGRKLPPTLVYDHPTIEALAAFLSGASPAAAEAPVGASASNEPIAIIGLGCRMPGAADPEAFWRLLHEGVDAIREVPAGRWEAGAAAPRWGGFLEQVDGFDAEFFGVAPREARGMDPQQRLLLEVAWEALENAGIAPDSLAGSFTGVFVGISSGDYVRLQARQPEAIDAYSGTGIAFSIAANRLSYVLDLRGPSWAVDTACSSSLVAVHQAVQSLRRGECRQALAGGVNLLLAPDMSSAFTQARMMAGDGRCKTFDAAADGYVRAEGCGVVVLKRLSEAQRDGDTVLAVIRGSAVNQDGRSNGLTAPNGQAQQAVLRSALADAGVEPGQIQYVEAHGTGTPLGDPIEVDALKAVLLQGRAPARKLWLGSVKTNVGHLESAAGIAGLIKAVLALRHEEIPAHLHLRNLNPYIHLDGTALAIPTVNQSWPQGDEPRLAGVSSFGFGGTNAHVILEQAPVGASRPERVSGSMRVLPLSARKGEALRELAQRWAAHLAAHPESALEDVCFTAADGRAHFEHRLAMVAGSSQELRERLESFAAGKPEGMASGRAVAGKSPRVAFLFTGQGSQYVGMGRSLYETEPVFRRALDQCAELLRPHLERPLLEVLFAASGEGALLDETAYTQPALFSIEYSLLELWRSWGVEPAAVMGHSVGEYVAACAAGVFTLEEGLRLIAARARGMQALPKGGEMVSLLAPEERVAAAIAPYAREVSIAAVNGPRSVVISGVGASVQAVVSSLASEGIEARRLKVSHAFHSPLMEPMLEEFERVAAGVRFQPPSLPLISNVTGQRAGPEVTTAGYWRRHVREPVRFSAGVQALEREGCEVFLEVGPAPVLIGLGRACLAPEGKTWLASLRSGQPDARQLLGSLAELYVRGVPVRWPRAAEAGAYAKLALPTYPFQRERYWLTSSPRPAAVPVPAVAGGHPLLGHRLPALAHQPDNHVWQSELKHGQLGFIQDHRIQGAVVVPGVVYVELALAAAAQVFGRKPRGASDIEYRKVLVVPEGGQRTLQVSLSRAAGESLAFQIHSRAEGQPADAWLLHASGRVL